MRPKTAFQLAVGVLIGVILFVIGLSEVSSDSDSCGPSTLSAGDRCREIDYDTGRVTERDVDQQRNLNHKYGFALAVAGGVLAVGCLVGGYLVALAARRPEKTPKSPGGGVDTPRPTGWEYQPANPVFPSSTGSVPTSTWPMRRSPDQLMTSSRAATTATRSPSTTSYGRCRAALASGEEMGRSVYGVWLLELPRPLPTMAIHRVRHGSDRAAVVHPVALTRSPRGFARRYRVTSPSPQLAAAVLTWDVTKAIYDNDLEELHVDGPRLLHESLLRIDGDPKRLEARLDMFTTLAGHLLASSDAVRLSEDEPSGGRGR